MENNRRILIVDDHAPIHQDFRKILRVAGDDSGSELAKLEAELFGGGANEAPKKATEPVVYQIDSAFQSDEALMMARRAANQGHPYALVFMDVRMPPNADGIATTAKLWETLPHTEVVLCSAYSDYSWDQIVAKLGVTDRLLFLRKPYDAIEVRQLALTLTTKWSLGAAARQLISDLEGEVAKRTAELEVERAKRVEASRLAALGEMAAGIAHEINNPLAIIKGSATLLNEYFANPGLFDTARAKSMSARIEVTVTRIAKIVKGLLDFSRNAETDLFQSISVKSIVTSTLDFCAARFDAARVKLNANDLPEDLTIECRSVQISQVLLNLLGNAFDAVEKHPERWVRIDVQDHGPMVEIAVVDSGLGVPSEFRDKILYPFFTTKKIGCSAGLGLSIAKGLVEAHHGHLTYDDKAESTRFVVCLPKKQPGKSVLPAA